MVFSLIKIYMCVVYWQNLLFRTGENKDAGQLRICTVSSAPSFSDADEVLFS